MQFAPLLILGIAGVGIDVGWQPVEDGSLEYIIQIEPQLLSTLKEGDELFVGVRPELRDVRRYRIVIGNAKLPREGKANPNERLARPERRPELRPAPEAKPDDLETYVDEVAPKPAELAPKPAEPLPKPAWSPAVEKDPPQIEIPKIDVPPFRKQPEPAKEPKDVESRPIPPILDEPVREKKPEPKLPNRYGDRPDDDVWPAAKPLPVPALSPAKEPLFEQPEAPLVPAPRKRREFFLGPDAEADDGSAPGDTKKTEEPAFNEFSNAFPKKDHADEEKSSRRAEPVPGVLPVTDDVQLVNSEESAAPADVEQRQPRNKAQTGSGLPESTTAATSATEAAPRPWLPLILCLFVLFASLGGNVFLGWISWDARHRLRDMMDRLRGTSIGAVT